VWFRNDLSTEKMIMTLSTQKHILILAVIGIRLGVGAQISLPEDFVPPEEMEAAERDAAPPAGEVEMDEGMKRLMNQMSGTALRQSLQEPPGEDWDRIRDRMKQRFQTGPDTLRVRLWLADGSRISGDIQNSSFFVRNSAGVFPLRMHEIQEMTPVEGSEGHFKLELQGEDLLRGDPSLTVLSLKLADGGGRIVHISHVVALRIELDAT
jgi:hypothetical protein